MRQSLPTAQECKLLKVSVDTKALLLYFRPRNRTVRMKRRNQHQKAARKHAQLHPLNVPPSPFTATSISTSTSTSGTGTTSNRAHASACASATTSSGVSANVQASTSAAMHSSPRSQLSVAPLCYDSDSEDDIQDCSLLPEMSPDIVHKGPVFSTPSFRSITLAVPRSIKASATFSGTFLIFPFRSQRLG